MSTNCVRCVVKKRTGGVGTGMMCDDCRELVRLRDAIDGTNGWKAEYDLLLVQLRSEAHGHKTMTAEVTRLKRALRDVQWVTLAGGWGESTYPTCVGCGAKSYGWLSTQPHSPDCKIEAALKPQGDAASGSSAGGEGE